MCASGAPGFGEEFDLAGVLKVDQPQQRLAQARANHQRAVVLHHQDHVLRADQAGEAFALGGRQRRTLEAAVVGDAAVERHRRQVDRRDRAAGAGAERGRVVHVGVQHRGRVRQQAVQRRVDAERGQLDRIAVLRDDRAVMRRHHQLADADFGPEIAFGVDQHQVRAARHGDAEMVADAALQAEPGGPAAGGGKLDLGLPDDFVVDDVMRVHVLPDIRCAVVRGKIPGRPALARACRPSLAKACGHDTVRPDKYWGDCPCPIAPASRPPRSALPSRCSRCPRPARRAPTSRRSSANRSPCSTTAATRR